MTADARYAHSRVVPSLPNIMLGSGSGQRTQGSHIPRTVPRERLGGGQFRMKIIPRWLRLSQLRTIFNEHLFTRFPFTRCLLPEGARMIPTKCHLDISPLLWYPR